MKQRYAVVDIESTGPKFDEGDRMFQFGCAIIEDGKIVEEVEWLINPETTISKHVEELTGCTNQMVKDAPYLEEVAPMIAQLVADRVIIAHNVSFDYPFLVQSLESVGISLEAECIDTVQLSQICLPMVDSYRLSDLSESLGIPHEAAHTAGSDATATAHLFLRLLECLREIPLVTLQQMRPLTPYLIAQTHLAFDEVWNERQHESLRTWQAPFVHGIAVNPQVLEERPTSMPVMEETAMDVYKRLLQQESILYRSNQEKIIQELEDNWKDAGNITFIQAPAGTGKTMAYLLSAITHATLDRPIWIATGTLLLQQQLVEQELEPLLAKMNVSVPYVSIKGKQHYISIPKFAQLLKHPKEYFHQRGALTLLGLCMWMLQTTTGDVTECNQVFYYKEIWEQITVHDAKEQGFDFYKRQRHYAAKVPIVITNQAYLIRELQTLPKENTRKPIVIVDEVQQIEAMLEQQVHSSLTFSELYPLQQEWNDYHLDQFVTFTSESEFLSRKINRQWLKLLDLLEDWEKQVKETELFSVEEWQQSAHFRILYAVRKNCVSLLKWVHEFKEQEMLRQKTSVLLKKVIQHCADFAKIKQGYISIAVSNKKRDGIHLESIEAAAQQWEKLQNKWHQFVGLSATIPSYSPLFYNILQEATVVTIPEDIPEVKHQVLLATDLLTPEVVITPEWVKQIVMVLKKIDAENPGRMLVLIHSIELLEALEQPLMEYGASHGISMLFQRTQTSSRKMQRRFQQEDHVWLLGVYSFWEGFDSGGVSIDSLVIPRLPFANPTSLSQQLVQRELQAQKREYFDSYALPKMVQQLSQGMGRMNRLYQEPASIWLLDSRAIRSSYAPQVQQAFPSGAKVIEKTFKKLLKVSKLNPQVKGNH